MTISNTVVVFFLTQYPPFSRVQWLLTPDLHRLLCEMLETVDANKAASMLGKHVVSKQKMKASGVGGGGGLAVTDTDHLTLHPTDPDITTSHFGALGSNKPGPVTV